MPDRHTLAETERAMSLHLQSLPLNFEASAAVSSLYRAANAVRVHLTNTVLRQHGLTWTGFVVLWGGGGTVGTDAPFVYVHDLDAHFKHAEAAGATIVSPITEHGFRSYTAADCEGRHWVFAQAGPRIGR